MLMFALACAHTHVCMFTYGYVCACVSACVPGYVHAGVCDSACVRVGGNRGTPTARFKLYLNTQKHNERSHRNSLLHSPLTEYMHIDGYDVHQLQEEKIKKDS